MERHKTHAEPKVLKNFAQLLGTEIKNWRLDIPEKYGRGYCTGFVFNEHIRMMIFNYELNEDLVLENPDVSPAEKTILFKFQNIFPESETLRSGNQLMAIPSVLIATRNLNPGFLIPIHTNTSVINIEVNVDYLNGIIDLSSHSTVLRGLLQDAQPLFFEQMIYPSLQKIVDELVSESVNETFKLFFMRIKAEELVCRLLIELEKRNADRLYTLNSKDIETIYQIKAQILKDLDNPPVIDELARAASMSPTKLKRLFKQIFGHSLFNYYQEFRMKEAALLLKEKNLSVSDVGYKLGFTNLSHFARVFKDHIGINPKQYSRI